MLGPAAALCIVHLTPLEVGTPGKHRARARARGSSGPAETLLAFDAGAPVPIHGGSGFGATPRSLPEIPGMPQSPISAGNACIQSGLRVRRGVAETAGTAQIPKL